MDSVQPDSDPDHHTDVDSDGRSSFYWDTEAASAKYTDAYAIKFGVRQLAVVIGSKLPRLQIVQKEQHHDHL